MSYAERAWNMVPDYFKESDVRMIAGLLLGLYILYTVVTVFSAVTSAAPVLNAVANTLRYITFLVAVYSLLALALNLHWGYTGLFNIGVAGFMAVGVYTMAILASPPTASPPGFGLPLPIAIVGGVVAAAVVGGIAALPALQLEADYLAIVTVGLSEIIRLTVLSTTFQKMTLFGATFGTGGGQGISTRFNDPASFLFEGPLSFLVEAANAIGIVDSVVISGAYSLFLILVAVPAYYVFLARVGNSPFGRVLKAIREDELVASSLGKNTKLFKIKVFMVGCGLMGLGGILWQGSYGFVNPNTFRPLVTFYVFTALIIGGPGSNTGSIVGGAVFSALLLEGPRQLAGLVSTVSQLALGTTLPAPNTFYAALVSLNPVMWLGYAIDNVSYMKFIFLGAVLVYLMQNRPDGLLGHRKESASSVDLSVQPKSTTQDGGESNE